MKRRSDRSGILAWLALFASTGTLVCCALPILFVTLGLGAVVATATSNFPLLIGLSRHKPWIFAASGILLVLAGWVLYRPGRHCPAQPDLHAACARANAWNRRIFLASATLWVAGFFAAYVALPLRRLLGF